MPIDAISQSLLKIKDPPRTLTRKTTTSSHRNATFHNNHFTSSPAHSQNAANRITSQNNGVAHPPALSAKNNINSNNNTISNARQVPASSTMSAFQGTLQRQQIMAQHEPNETAYFDGNPYLDLDRLLGELGPLPPAPLRSSDS